MTIEQYFAILGYQVSLEGRVETGERWYEIYDDAGLAFQISMPLPPITELIADLPGFLTGKPRVHPFDYWFACEDTFKLHKLIARVHKKELPDYRQLELEKL